MATREGPGLVLDFQRKLRELVQVLSLENALVDYIQLLPWPVRPFPTRATPTTQEVRGQKSEVRGQELLRRLNDSAEHASDLSTLGRQLRMFSVGECSGIGKPQIGRQSSGFVRQRTIQHTSAGSFVQIVFTSSFRSL